MFEAPLQAADTPHREPQNTSPLLKSVDALNTLLPARLLESVINAALYESYSLCVMFPQK